MSRVQLSEAIFSIGANRTVSVPASGSVTVYERGGTALATIYSASTGGTALPNPRPVTDGYATGYLDGGSYDLVASANGEESDRVEWEATRADSVVIDSEGTEAAIQAAALTAFNAGGGLVRIKPGADGSGNWQQITLTEPLPNYAGVHYTGFMPVVRPISVSDQTPFPTTSFAEDFDFIGGTVLEGDGTFSAFEHEITDQGSVQADVSETTRHLHMTNLGFDNFTYGIRAGANNVMGIFGGLLDQLYFRRCTQWAIHSTNQMFCEVGYLRSCLCTVGNFYFASKVANTTMIPGNFRIGHIFASIPRATNRTTRGIVFESNAGAATTCYFNEIKAHRLQCNRFGTSLLSQTANLTNTSSTVAVSDGSLWRVGFWATPTTTAGGLTAGQMYYVKTVSGNNLTLSNSPEATAITMSATTAVTLTSYGFPNIEVIAADSLAAMTNCELGHVDVEGVASAGLVLSGTIAVKAKLAEVPGTALQHVIGRRFSFSHLEGYASGLKTDMDGSSATSDFIGSRSEITQRSLRGIWYDHANSCNVLALGTSDANGDLHFRNGFLYPVNGVGEQIIATNSDLTVNGDRCGDIIAVPSAARTYTLTTIGADSTILTSHVGMWARIFNLGTEAITINTDGAQTFDGVASKYSLKIRPGQILKVTAVKNASSTLFWATEYGHVATKSDTTVIAAGNLGTSYALDCAGSPKILLTGTLNDNCTLTASNMVAGQEITLRVTQDGTGGRTLTISPTPKTPGGAGVVVSTGANAIDLITMVSFDGSALDASKLTALA